MFKGLRATVARVRFEPATHWLHGRNPATNLLPPQGRVMFQVEDIVSYYLNFTKSLVFIYSLILFFYVFKYMMMYLDAMYMWICIFNWIYLSETDFQVKMMLSEDGSGRGAALVAAVAHRMRVARSSVSSES